MLRLKRAWSGPSTPLTIVCPTDHTVPPDRRYVFVDDCYTAVSQHSTYLVEYQPCVLGMMQNVAQQDRIEALVFDGKVPAVVGQVIDASGGVVADVQSDHCSTEHALEMVRDEAIAAADVEDVRMWWKHFGDFKRHVVSPPDFAASSHSLEATFDGCG